MPAASSTAVKTSAATPGQRNERFRLSSELRLHAISGPTPVSSSNAKPIGTLTPSKYALSTLIFSSVRISDTTGNRVPQSTEKQLATSSRLLNRKLDSRDKTLSSLLALFR